MLIEIRTTILGALLLVCVPGAARAAGVMIESVGSAGWVAPYAPMSMAQAADMQSVVNGSHALGLGLEIELSVQFRNNLNEFHPQIESDRRILGAMKLPQDFSARFEQAHRGQLDGNVDYRLAIKALAVEVVSAYKKALPFIQHDIQFWSRKTTEDVKDGRIGIKQLSLAADNLDLFKFYGSQAAREVEKVQSLARVAKNERTMDLARKLAAQLLEGKP